VAISAQASFMATVEQARSTNAEALSRSPALLVKAALWGMSDNKSRVRKLTY
jgi:hypothetical protein